jgi:hypothetical protein
MLVPPDFPTNRPKEAAMARFEDVAAALQDPRCAVLKQELEKFREMYYSVAEENNRLRGEMSVIAALANSRFNKDAVLKSILDHAVSASRQDFSA